VSVERKVLSARLASSEITKELGDRGKPVFVMRLICEIEGGTQEVYRVTRERKKDVPVAAERRIKAAADGCMSALYKEENGEHWGFSERYSLGASGLQPRTQ
jgi:hypothetical protein